MAKLSNYSLKTWDSEKTRCFWEKHDVLILRCVKHSLFRKVWRFYRYLKRMVHGKLQCAPSIVRPFPQNDHWLDFFGHVRSWRKILPSGTTTWQWNMNHVWIIFPLKPPFTWNFPASHVWLPENWAGAMSKIGAQIGIAHCRWRLSSRVAAARSMSKIRSPRWRLPAAVQGVPWFRTGEEVSWLGLSTGRPECDWYLQI